MKTSLLTGKRVAIIGGGPVGLLTARLLQRSETQVTVYERDPYQTARLLGGTLDIHRASGQKALHKAGLLDAFYAASQAVEERMTDAQGQVLLEVVPTQATRFDQPEIDRPDLQRILLDSLVADTVVWNRHVTDVVPQATGFIIHFQDGGQARADVVVVADGSMSKARRLITDQLPQYTGTYAIQGEIYQPQRSCPAMYQVIKQGNLACIAERQSVFVHSKSNGHLNFYVSFRPTASWQADYGVNFSDRSSVNCFLASQYAGWGALFHELFTASDAYTGLPLRVQLVDQPWKPHQHITLVGDAAHVMPPFGGEGVNMGLRDALLLTDNLTNGHFTSLQAAIDDYESQMRAYALPAQQASLLADERIHTQLEDPAERIKRLQAIWQQRSQTEPT